MKKNFFIFGILVLILLSLANQNVKAENQTVGLSVSQSVFNLSLAPGETAVFPIDLENITQQKERVNWGYSDLILGENNQIKELTPKNELTGLADWLSVDSKELFLDHQEKVKLNITVTVPKDASVGSHYGVVNIRALPEINGNNFQEVVVGGQLAVTVLVNVKGEISGRGELKNFSAPLFSKKEVDFSAEFENDGNIHYIPHGEITIRSLFGRYRESLNLEKHFVFPGKSFSFATHWSLPSLFGVYVAEAAFVDGDGVMRGSSRLVFGDLSFIPPVILLSIFGIILKKYAKNRRKNA